VRSTAPFAIPIRPLSWARSTFSNDMWSHSIYLQRERRIFGAKGSLPRVIRLTPMDVGAPGTSIG
jgi:hypothetical protein